MSRKKSGTNGRDSDDEQQSNNTVYLNTSNPAEKYTMLSFFP